MLALFSTVRPGCRVFTTRYPIVPDRWALPLCNRHHREQHDAGSERDAVHVDETINESMVITGLTQFLRDLVVGMLGQLPNGVAADAWVETVTSRRVIPPKAKVTRSSRVGCANKIRYISIFDTGPYFGPSPAQMLAAIVPPPSIL